MSKPKLLVGTPEIILDLNVGMGNLQNFGINFSTGGMAPVASADIIALIENGAFDVYAAIPKWESSLRELNDLTTKEIKMIESAIPDKFFLINHPSFNKVHIEGSNTQMYADSSRFSSVDRALAFSSGIVNTVIPKVKPDLFWTNDWMLGPAAVVAKAIDLGVISMGHNVFTKETSYDNLLSKGIEIRNFDNYKPADWACWYNGNFDFMASEVNSSDDFITVSPSFLDTILSGAMDYLSPTVTAAIKEKAKHKHPDGRPRVHGYLNPLEKSHSNFLNAIEKEGLENTIVQRKKKGEELRAELGLKEGGSFLVFPNRLYSSQKNPELAIDNAIYLAKKYDLRILFLAGGDPNLVNRAIDVSLASNGLVAYSKFDKRIEEKIKESDNSYGLLTSNFEPCGGPNLNYPVEGTLIVGHAIDGIKDTVTTDNGFPYQHNNIQDLEGAIVKMKEFASRSDRERYIDYIKIANTFLAKYSPASRASKLVDEIFMPLYEERMRNK
ncbi:MAG: glycogen/starch synthase [Candidatus Woesearchaeota archaeon]|jgi:glycogen synthase